MNTIVPIFMVVFVAGMYGYLLYSKRMVNKLIDPEHYYHSPPPPPPAPRLVIEGQRPPTT
ncbi:MAG: hypothetical protein ACJ71Z_07060 [Aeromicrobium sp.]